MNTYYDKYHPMGSVILDKGSIYKLNPETGKPIMVTIGYFGVTCKLTSINGDSISYQVGLSSLHSEVKETAVISAHDINNRAKIISSLSSKGLIICDEKLFNSVFKDSLSHCIQSDYRKTLVDRTGWFRNHRAYSTGSKIICSDDTISSCHVLADNVSQNMQTAGTFKQWKKHVLQLCINNPFLLTAIMISLSSLLLEVGKVGSKWVNWFGMHGKGKTTILQVAASVFGNGIDPSQESPDLKHPPYISKMNSSQTGIEATMGGHFQRPFIADELGEGSRLNWAELVYLVSSNKGTITATANRQVAKNHHWQTVALSAGEVSIAEKITGKGEVKGGQLDRAIDIPTTGNIFFDIGTAANEGAFAGQLKDACATYYGTAAEFFINWLIANPDAYANIQANHLQAIEERLTPHGCDEGAKRVVKFFAHGVMTAFAAIEAEMLPCSQEHVVQSFEEIVDRWWLYRKTTSPAELLSMILVQHFDRVVEASPPIDYKKELIYFDEQKDLYCFNPDLFKELIPGCSNAFIKSLVEKNFLVADSNNQGRLTKRYFYGKNKSHCFFAINGASINTELERLVNEKMAKDGLVATTETIAGEEDV